MALLLLAAYGLGHVGLTSVLFSLLAAISAGALAMALGDYPRGQVTWNGVSLYQATDISYTHTNGAKLKSTLRKDPAGTVRGARGVTGSMNILLPDDPGDQDPIDWKSAVQFKIPQTALIKMPAGARVMLDLVITEEGAEVTLEDGVKKPIKFTGYFIDV